MSAVQTDSTEDARPTRGDISDLTGFGHPVAWGLALAAAVCGLLAAMAFSADDPYWEQWAAQRIEERASQAERIDQFLSYVGGGVGLLAVIVIAICIMRSRRSSDVRPPLVPWSGREGFAVIVFGSLFWLAMLFLETWAVHAFPWSWSIAGWHLLWFALPTLWLMRLLLLRPHRTTLKSTFRLSSTFVSSPVLAGGAIVILGAHLVSMQATRLFDIQSSTGLAREIGIDLLVGSGFETVMSMVFRVFWAPFFEELIFRGLLYGTLRHWLAVGPAALLSGTVFAVVHFYGVIGYLIALVAGVAAAFIYERTRSLLPCMAGHALVNGLATWVQICVYR